MITMDVIPSPDSVDVQSFQFKLHRRIQAFSATNQSPFIPLNLIVAASRFGLLFVGSPDKSLHVFELKTLAEEDGPKCPRRVLPLQAVPVHLSVNCTHEIVCIVMVKQETPVALMYNTKSFGTQSPDVIREIRLSASAGVQLCRLLWNPCQPEALAVCTSDGALSVYTCKPNSFDAQTKAANARCLSWSPKGKQIVTGNADGSLSQYKPDLALVKNIPAPIISGFENTIQAIAVHWISNYQFSAVYCDPADPDKRPCLAIVNTPKGGSAACVNYEDICYGMGGARPAQYFLTHLPMWGVLLASSANSMEVGVLGTIDQNNWQQWIQVDEARAELPLTDDKQENYPIGVTYDDAALYHVPSGDETFLNMPVIHILSHTGMLVSFIAINFSKDAPSVCSLPDSVPLPPQTLIVDIEPPTQATLAPVALTASSSQDISFVISQNTITSTPTIPKSSTPFSISKPIVTNLFGVTKDQTIQDRPPVPLTEAVQTKPPPAEMKPPSIALQPFSISNTFGATPQAKPFANIVKPTANIFTAPSVPQEKSLDLNLQKPPQVQTIKHNIVSRDEEEQTKTYETFVRSASSDTIKTMLLKEVNDFQLELFDLLQRCQKVETKIGTSAQMKEISSVLLQCDREPIENVWSNKDVNQQVIMLKQNLIKTCQILAEARMQPESLEIEQLAQLDPVSSNRMASIKQTLYYIETQLKQINNVLDDQWETFQNECKKKVNALRGIRDGDVMKMPTLDMVYRPLVNHHEILTRHHSTVKALKKCKESLKSNTFNNNGGKPLLSQKIYKSDPLSSLTKNLLNLSLQPGDILDAKNKNIYEREAKFTVKKQNALRDILLNHRTSRIKSIKVEPPNRLQAYYEWNLEQEKKSSETTKAAATSITKETWTASTPVVPVLPTSFHPSKPQPQSTLPRVEFHSKVPEVTESSPLTHLNKFVTNLPDANQKVSFPSAPLATSPMYVKTNTVSESPKSAQIIQQPIKIPQPTLRPEVKKDIPTSFGSISITAVSNTPSLPKTADIASVKTTFNDKQNNYNSFMGQNICSPTPRTTASIFSNPTQISFGTPSISSTFGETKSIFTSVSDPTLTPAPVQTAAPPVAPQGVPLVSPPVATSPTIPSLLKPSPVATSSLPTVINTFSSQSPTVKPVDKAEAKSSTVETSVSIQSSTQSDTGLGSLLVSNPVNLPQTEISISATPLTISSVNSKPSIFGSQLPQQSIFGSLSVTTTTVATSANSEPPPSVTASATIATVAPAQEAPKPLSAPLGSFFAQSPSSTAPLPFGAQTKPVTTSVFPAVTTTTSSAFGVVPQSPQSPQSPTSASTLFANANASIGSPTGALFDALTVTTSAGPASVFGSPAPVTCASSPFGVPNASIATPVTSLFGNASIATSEAAPFGSSAGGSGGSIFSGSSAFTGQSTFGQSGGSLFGGSSSPFGQAQAPTGNVFGGGSTFGGFGTSPPSGNIFGQSAGSSPGGTFSNVFGGTGGAGTTKPSVFGVASPQPSIFGSPAASSTVFGASPSFGSKPVFGQTPGFGSSPTGATGFGSFSGSGDQQNISQTGFGSASAFSKPPGAFGASPTFGSTTGFGSPPAFGGSPSFGSPGKMFGSPVSDPGFGATNQQSSTFENLATQSTITFGNLAQQSQQPQPAAPVFQGSPSFSMWR